MQNMTGHWRSMMIKIDGSIRFQTTRPLSQQTGMEMWKMGSHFQALAGHGGRTYQLTTSGQSESLVEGIQAITESIEELVRSDGHNEATITEVEMQVRA